MNVDQELVQRVQAGDKKAFDLLIMKYQQRIIHVITGFVHDPVEAMDVAQEALLKLIVRCRTFAGTVRSIRGFIVSLSIPLKIILLPVRVDHL